MASIKYIQRYGNQLAIFMADGTKQMAFPTHNTDVWLVTAAGSGPGPEPGSSLYSWPYAPGWISDPYGLRADVGRWHEGHDFAGGPAGYGNPIPCIGEGVVQEAGWYSDSYGFAVLMDHGVLAGGPWDGYTCKSLYAHMPGNPPVSNGQAVGRGGIIGYIGESGASFGAHLHMEIHCIPPGGSMINDYTNPNPAPPSNRTAVDPTTFMAAYNPTGSWLI